MVSVATEETSDTRCHMVHQKAEKPGKIQSLGSLRFCTWHEGSLTSYSKQWKSPDLKLVRRFLPFRNAVLAATSQSLPKSQLLCALSVLELPLTSASFWDGAQPHKLSTLPQLTPVLGSSQQTGGNLRPYFPFLFMCISSEVILLSSSPFQWY